MKNMKQKIIVVIAGVVVLGVIWYLVQIARESANKKTLEELLEEGIIVDVLERSGSGIQGTAAISQARNGVKVILRLNGVPENTMQPAHIYFNHCDDIGRVKHPLNFPFNGYSQTIVATTLEELLEETPLSISIRKSTTDGDEEVSCGSITW